MRTATVTANAGKASAQTLINIPCSGSGAPLPDTSTAPPGAPTRLAGIAALALFVIGGSALARI